jgi:biopolymer transport protein ExbD
MQWPAALCAAVGTSLLVLFCVACFVRPPVQKASITDCETVGQSFQWAQKLPLKRAISGLPTFGLIGGMTLALLAIMMFMMVMPSIPVGLEVHLLKPGAGPSKSDAWTEPLVIWVADAGPSKPPNLYLNSKLVPWDELDHTLKEELGRRRDWVVYVGGDDVLAWQYVATVIDVCRGYHAKVFLVTGNTAKRTVR